MAELIFFAVIILFSILESVAKKRKKQKMEEAEAPEPEPSGERWEEVSAYEVEAEAAPTSEAMVPGDIWEEIGALARRERPRKPDSPASDRAREPVPRKPSAPIPTTSPIHRGQVGRGGEVGSREGVAEHPVHRAHAEYGTDPSERRPMASPRGGGPGREVRALRKALMEGGPDAARRAVILHEVLGPPLAYRDSTSMKTGLE